MAVVPCEEIAALLAVPPDEFVAARTARAKALRADGERELAAALGKVRKPLRLVWIVGELARRHPDVAQAAANVAAELEDAQAGSGGVRPLLKRFRDVVAQAAELADELDGVVDRLEVGLALREVLADPDARRAWLDGCLLALPGDEDDGAVEVAQAPPTAPRRGKGRGAKAADEDDAAAEREREEARSAHEAAVAAATGRVTEAERAAAAAEDDRSAAAVLVADLTRRLEELEAQVGAAREALASAETAAAGAEASAEAARAALAEVEADAPGARGIST